MENIFGLDFAQPQQQRLKQIRDFTGKGFFTKEATQFHCPICNAEIPLNSNHITCSAKCRERYAGKKKQQRSIQSKQAGITPPNIIARKEFLKNNRIRIDEAIRCRRRYAIKQFYRYLNGQLGLADAQFSEYLKGERP